MLAVVSSPIKAETGDLRRMWRIGHKMYKNLKGCADHPQITQITQISKFIICEICEICGFRSPSEIRHPVGSGDAGLWPLRFLWPIGSGASRFRAGRYGRQRMMGLLPLLFALLIADTSARTRVPLFELHGHYALTLAMAGSVVAWLAVSEVVARLLARSGGRKWMVRWDVTAHALILAWFAWACYGWGWTAWAGSYTLTLLPWVFMQAIHWWCMTVPVRVVGGHPWSRWGRLVFQFRFSVLPIAIILPCLDLGAWLANWWKIEHWFTGFWGMLAAAYGVQIFILVALVVFPLGLIYLWGARPMPDSDLARLMRRACGVMGVRVAGLMRWPVPGGRIFNAAVVGLVPPLRYVLFTDDLLREMEVRQQGQDAEPELEDQPPPARPGMAAHHAHRHRHAPPMDGLHEHPGQQGQGVGARPGRPAPAVAGPGEPRQDEGVGRHVPAHHPLSSAGAGEQAGDDLAHRQPGHHAAGHSQGQGVVPVELEQRHPGPGRGVGDEQGEQQRQESHHTLATIAPGAKTRSAGADWPQKAQRPQTGIAGTNGVSDLGWGSESADFKHFRRL